MSWNCLENKILEDDLDKLGEDKKLKVLGNWKKTYNPHTKKITYVNPQAYIDLREALLAIVPLQPETLLDKINKVIDNE